MAGSAPTPKPVRWLPVLLTVAASAALLWGWRTFLFTVDDAFIAFRYSRNLLMGWGLTWNPPPFRPVEGYSSFSWVLLMAALWKVTGLPPTVTANLVSLVCGGGALWVGARMVRDMELPGAGGPRYGWVALVLLGVLTNRTFLTWTSSGLETAFFDLLFLLWLAHALKPPARRTRGWGPVLSTWAALLALTRPDGLLYAAATVPIVVLGRRSLLGLAPLLAVGAHLAWRWSYYGAWFPNTYYAKVGDPWPEAGLRYLASFGLEYGIWVWVALVGAALVRLVSSAAGQSGVRLGSLEPLLRRGLPAATVCVHVAYYTYQVGGDHFEYRVLSHLVVPLLVSCAWMGARVLPRAPALPLLAMILASWPLPWLHWSLTRNLDTRPQTQALTLPLAPYVPSLVRPLVATWDEWQAWLIACAVCRRHQEHKIFLDFMDAQLPTEEAGARLRWEHRPLWATESVGLAGWLLPQVAILDLMGLNDRIIGHGPVRLKDGRRQMAHGHRPPEGYVECFRLNLVGDATDVELDPAVAPMTDEEIHRCEEAHWP